MDNKAKWSKDQTNSNRMVYNIEQHCYLRDTSVSYPNKCIGVTSKKMLEILKGCEYILQSLVLKDHRLFWVTTQLVLPRDLARPGLLSYMAKANPSMINPNIL